MRSGNVTEYRKQKESPNMQLKISIIVPVYNVEPYLRQCLDSIVNQTYQNLEIIAVDDGSPDHCGAICDEYAAKDERIRVIHKPNAGVSAARNDGVKAATGTWTMFMDSDDWLEADFVENMMAAVPAEMTDIVFAGGYILEFPQNSRQVHAFEKQISNLNENVKTSLCGKTLASNFITKNPTYSATIATAWNKLLRTEFLQHSGIYFNTKLHPQEDILFCLDAIEKAECFCSTDYIGYHYRQDVETSALHRFNPDWPHMADVFLPWLESFVNNWPEKQLLQEALDARTMLFVSQIFRCYFFHPQNPKSRKEIKHELDQFKSLSTVKHAIWSNSDKTFTKRQNVLRYVLRLPWVWPARLLYMVRKKLKRSCLFTLG